MHRLFGALLATVAAAPLHSELLTASEFTAQRFSGVSSLSPGHTQSSVSGRFLLKADLHAAVPVSMTSARGRFSATARLTVPDSLATPCGPLPDSIFNNGYEN